MQLRQMKLLKAMGVIQHICSVKPRLKPGFGPTDLSFLRKSLNPRTMGFMSMLSEVDRK